MLSRSLIAILLIVSVRAIGASDDDSSKKKEPPPPPTCITAQLKESSNNAKSIAESMNGIADGITARALGTNRVVVCGDDRQGAISNLGATAAQLGKETTPSPGPRESHVVRLFFNRDSPAIAQVLQKAFPKLYVAPIGSDTLALGASDGSDAELARNAKRWIASIDVPRPEVSLNVWSVQLSSKKLDTVNEFATGVRNVVSEHNRALQEALGRAHSFLSERAKKPADFYAPILYDYLRLRYVSEGQPGMTIDRKALNACDKGQYCLGYGEVFEIEPNISSLLLNVLASKEAEIASLFVDKLEHRNSASAVLNTRSYRLATQTEGRKGLRDNYFSGEQQPSPKTSVRETRYGTSTDPNDCELVAKDYYASKSMQEKAAAESRRSAPVFPCLREALSDATAPIALARIRIGIVHFLFNRKFRQQYPDDFDPEDTATAWMDSMTTPLLTSFNRDMASFLRNVRDKIQGESGKRQTEFASNGIVTLSTLSSIPSSVATSSQSAFKLPPTFSLKDFLSASTPPAPASGQTPAQAAAAKLPGFLAANLVPGVSLPLAAALSMDPTPAIATVGRNLNLIVTSNALPGASAAELNVNLVSQEEAPPTIQRGSDSKPDTKSRVAKHNLQTVVRVDSLRLFELSSFNAELRRGGDSIPILPVPYLEIPVIGGILRFPLKPGQIFHRSFAIVSAVVLPTSADLAYSVSPETDVVITPLAPTLSAKGPTGADWNVRYTVIAERQAGILRSEKQLIVGQPRPDSPVKLTWDKVGDDARYSVYRTRDGSTKLLAKGLPLAHFEDIGDQDVEDATIPESGLATTLTRITPASFLSSGVKAFHNERLKCIAKEALNEDSSTCAQKTLSSFPSEN